MYRKIILFFILFPFFCFTQEREIFGYIKDTKGNGVPSISVVFKSKEDKTIFLLTDKKGYYKTSLNKNRKYTVEVYPINLDKITKEITEDFSGEFIIEIPSERVFNIEEVKLKQPITYKGDTIVYNVASFSNGTERKLKDIARKLPGFEVTAEGAVKVNGESIGTTLVDGQPFFNGNTKLALDNIPADVLEDIEVISYYNENQISKETTSNTTTALNVKLKEDKKNLVFGDATLGGGFDKNHYAHLNAFQFKKNNSFALIGDINNIGEQSFTINDFFTLKGGVNALLGDADSFFSESDKNLIALTLPVENFASFDNHFLTINHQKHTENKRWNNLILFSHIKSNLLDSAERKLVNEQYEEQTHNEKKNDRNLIYGTFDFIYKPSVSLFIKNTFYANVNLEDTSVDKNGLINLNAFQNKNEKDGNTFEFNNYFTLDKVINPKMTYGLVSKINWSQNTNDEFYSSESPFLIESLLEYNSSLYTLNTNYKNQSFESSLSNTLSYKLNATNRLNFGLDLFFINDKIFSSANVEKDLDRLFYNDSDYSRFRTNAKFEYLYRNQKILFKAGTLLSANYFSYSKHLNVNTSDFRNFFILPYLETKYEWNSLHKIQLNYSLHNAHYGLYNFLNGLIVNDFNSVYTGDELYRNNRLKHSLSLKYSRYNGWRKLGYNFSANYNSSNGLVNTLKTDGIMRYSSVLFYDRFLDNYTFSAEADKEIFKIKYYGAIDYKIYNGVNFINDLNGTSQKRNTTNYRIGAMTRWKKPINIDIKNFWFVNHFKNENDSSFQFTNMITSLDTDARFLKHFQMTIGIKRVEISKISDEKERIFQGRFNLTYSNENSPLEISFLANNIFNNKAIIENTINNIFISSSKQHVLPRTFTLKITYKL